MSFSLFPIDESNRNLISRGQEQCLLPEDHGENGEKERERLNSLASQNPMMNGKENQQKVNA